VDVSSARAPVVRAFEREEMPEEGRAIIALLCDRSGGSDQCVAVESRARGQWQAGCAVLSVPVKSRRRVARADQPHAARYGSLRTDDEVAVSSKVMGKVKRVLVKEGDHVSKGSSLPLHDR
jgi:biotin carboxyl carrier protein